MALGSFFLLIDQGQVDKKIIYTQEEITENILDDNAILKIRMRHQTEKHVVTLLPTAQILSYVKQIEVKRRVVEIICGVILHKDINSAVHYNSLELMTTRLTKIREEKEDKILAALKENHSELFDQPQFILDKKELEKRLSERVKELNKAGEFEEANELLKKIKKIPKKLYEAHAEAEKAMENEDYDKAVKEFTNAKRYANELEEGGLVQLYIAKIQLAKKTPSLLKKRAKILKKALENLRNDNFSRAQKYFKKAADYCEKLMDTRGAEEYALKAKALAEYAKVEKQFNS